MCTTASPPPRVTHTGSPVGVRLKDERGAIVVHVAVAFAGLLAFSALTIDLGVLWASRAQAQNAADSSALAGAVSLAYVDPNREDYARDAASSVAAAHEIWGEAPLDPGVTFDCPPGVPPGGSCVKVEVGRTAATGSPLPAYISRMFGFLPSEVRATGTAQVLIGNSSPCLKPFGIPDRWINNRELTLPPDPGAGNVFERYVDEGGERESTLLLAPPDLDAYDPPGPLSAGSGYDFSQVGQRVEFAFAPYPYAATQEQTFFPLALERASPTGSARGDFEANVTGCSGIPVSVGDTVIADLDIHPIYFDAGLTALINSDAGATWDDSLGRVVNSSSAYTRSPRIIAVAVYDPDEFRRTPRSVQQVPLRVRNIIGLFIDDYTGGVIHAVVVVLPGRYDPNADELTQNASFLRTVALVR